jgi:outer membrane cobalamin receptor
LGFLFDRTIYSVDTTFFYTHIEDRLTYHPTTYVNINAGRTYSKGIEEAITFKLNESIKQITRLNLTESFNLSNGTRLARRPEFMAFHGYEYSNDLWTSTLNGKFKSPTADVDNNGNSTKNKKYVTFNFDLEYNLNKSSKLGLNVENILDESFQDVWGYNNGGRMINLRYKMSF